MIAGFLDKVQKAFPERVKDGAVKWYDPDNIDQIRQSGPKAIGLELIEDNYAGPRQGSTQLATADTRVRWHVWDETTEATHELRRELINAVHLVSHGSYRLESGTWHTQAVNRKGAIYVFTMQIQIPIVRSQPDAEGSVEIEAFTQLEQFNDDAVVPADDEAPLE